MRLKKFLSWFFTVILAYFLITSLLFLANALVFTSITAKPERVKSILSDSGVYQKLPETLYTNIEKENKSQKTDINLSDPAIKQAALASFSPKFFQTNVEQAIDGSYDWLEGKTDEPKLSIDIKDAKNKFIDTATDAQAEKAKKLKPCTFQQLNQINSSNIFNLKCLPPGINIKQVAEKAKTDLKNNPDFLPKTTFSTEDLKTNSGNSLLNKNSDVPDKFQNTKKIPLMLVLIAVISAAGIYFISADRTKGLLRVAKILVASGVFILLAPIGIRLFTDRLLPAISSDPVISDIVSPIINQFNSAAASLYYALGAAILFVGAALLVAIHKNIIKFEKPDKNEA